MKTLSQLLASGAEAQTLFARLSVDDQLKFATFLNELVIASVVEPKIVRGAPLSEDEIAIEDIPEADMEFLIKQAVEMSPAVPVATKGGDVPLQAITDFRHVPAGGVPTGAGGDVLPVQPAPVRSHRNRRRRRSR